MGWVGLGWRGFDHASVGGRGRGGGGWIGRWAAGDPPMTVKVDLRMSARQRLPSVPASPRTHGLGHIAVARARTRPRRQRPVSGYS